MSTEKEYFVVTNSFAAPFFSDQGNMFVTAISPQEALEIATKRYTHPCGLYSAGCYASADAYHKGQKVLARWLRNLVIEQERLTKGLEGYSICHESESVLVINGIRHIIENPCDGRVVE